MSRTKTDQRTDREQYTISNAGETGRNLSTPQIEHKQVTRNGDINTHIAQHQLQVKHQIDWDSATCIILYRLLSMTHFRKLVYKLRANATELQSTITSTIQKTYWQTQTKLTIMTEWLTTNNIYLTHNKWLWQKDWLKHTNDIWESS